MGMAASTALIPVASDTLTGARAMIGGAGRSTGQRSPVVIGPPSSSGSPSAFKTRPSSSVPTGVSSTRPVRSTIVPACKPPWLRKSTTPTSASPRSKATPVESSAKRTSSIAATPGRPRTRATP